MDALNYHFAQYAAEHRFAEWDEEEEEEFNPEDEEEYEDE